MIQTVPIVHKRDSSELKVVSSSSNYQTDIFLDKLFVDNTVGPNDQTLLYFKNRREGQFRYSFFTAFNKLCTKKNVHVH